METRLTDGAANRGLSEELSARTTCIVSRRFRFIFLLIAKNASSTLRAELGKSRYGGYESRYGRLILSEFDVDTATRSRILDLYAADAE